MQLRIPEDKPIYCLITGITGTLGQAVTAKLLNDLGENVSILGVSRDEQKQRLLPKDDRLKLRLGDVRDFESLTDACGHEQGAYFDYIFHFAALKCVDTLEENPTEAYRTNVEGTRNVAKLASQFQAKLILTSTDKAVSPINAYGYSKALAERVALTADPQNVVCRYGNVLGSRGSIVETLQHTLMTSRKAALTHKDMTRFWMTVEQARDLVLEAAFLDRWGIVVPSWIRSAPVVDLIREVADQVLGVGALYETVSIGVRKGEKMHECLANEYEAKAGAVMSNDKSRLMSKAELKDLIHTCLAGGDH